MEDRLVKRKDKLKLIEEAMRWLKPPLTKVNYLLKPFQRDEGKLLHSNHKSHFQENYGLGSRREMEKDSEATPIKAFPPWAESDQVSSCTNHQALTI